MLFKDKIKDVHVFFIRHCYSQRKRKKIKISRVATIELSLKLIFIIIRVNDYIAILVKIIHKILCYTYMSEF